MSLPKGSVCYFRRVCISREKSLLFSSCLSVRLSACISADPTGQIFVKFIIGGGGGLRKSVEKLHFFAIGKGVLHFI